MAKKTQGHADSTVMFCVAGQAVCVCRNMSRSSKHLTKASSRGER